MSAEQIERIRAELFALPTKRKHYDELLRLYRHVSIESASFPESCLNLIVEILSTEGLFSQKGIDQFLVEMSSDMDRLSADQKAKLLEAIAENYPRYNNIEFCWSLGDLIAR